MEKTMKPFLGFGLMAALAGCVTMTTSMEPQLERPTMPEVRAVASYEFGQSREPLTVVEQMVRDAMKAPDGGRALAADLSAILVSSSSRDGKLFACRQLAKIGTEANVPSIAPLLLDAGTADMARFALEPIPGRSVDLALMDALDAAPREAKAGIINSLGARGSSRSASIVARYKGHPDEVIAEAARSASRKIGG